MAKVNVFQFQDYRELLLALINQRKSENKVFSYRWFSMKAHLSSPNFLNLVVKGKRHLSTETVEKVIEIFQLNKDEGDFFRNLVHFNKSKTLSDKEHFAKQIIKSKKFQNEYPLSKDQFEYYSEWHNIPVKEMLHLNNLEKTEDAIATSLLPQVSRQDVRAALEKLHALDLIEEDSGQWKPKKESVSTGNKFASYGVVQYHKKMLELAAQSLDRFPSDEREISSVTVGLSDDSFLKIKKLIEEFRSQLMAIAEDDKNKERIYQINFQLFPLSQKKDGSL